MIDWLARTAALLTTRAVLSGWLGALCVSCGAQVDPATDGSTHFWRTCSTDSECGTSYQCLCGRCTEPCNETAQCGAANAQCALASESMSCELSGNVCVAASGQGAGSNSPPDDSLATAGADAQAPPSEGVGVTVTDERDSGLPPVSDGSSSGSPDASISDSQDDAPDDTASSDDTPSDATSTADDAVPDDIPADDGSQSTEPSTPVAPNDASAPPPVAPEWLPFATLENSPRSASMPSVTLDAAGTVLSVWSERTSSLDVPPTFSVGANRYSLAQGWGESVLLTSGSDFLGSVCLAGNAAGAAIVSWVAEVESTGTLWAITQSETGEWSEATPVGPTLGAVADSDCSIDQQGNAIVAWSQYDATSSYLLSAARFTLEAGWQEPEAIGGAKAGASRVSVASDDAGNALTLWNDWEGETAEMWSTRYLAAEGWQQPVLVPTTVGFGLQQVELALQANGDGVGIWMEHAMDGSQFDVRAARFSSIDGWASSERLSNDEDATLGTLAVGIDASGAALAVWEGLTQVETQYLNTIRMRRYVPGEGWAASEVLADDAGHVSLAVSGSGYAVAAWRVPYDYAVDGDIAAAFFSEGTGWSSAELFANDPVGDSGEADVAVNATGSAAIVWRQSTESQQGDILSSQLQ